MTALTDQDYIDEIRNLVNDGPLSKLVKNDDRSSIRRPGQKSFPLSNQNIVNPSTVTEAIFQAMVDGSAPADATLDDATIGVGSVATAPTRSIVFIYYFQFFTDDQITRFRNNGLRQVGVDPTNPASIANAGQSLYMAACYLAAAETLRVNAQVYVKYYEVSAGGKSFQKGTIFKNISQQAKDYEAKALEIRKSIYTRQDRNLIPSFGVAGSCFGAERQGPTR